MKNRSASPIDDRLAVAKDLIQAARLGDAEAELRALAGEDLQTHQRVETCYMLAVARRYLKDYEGAIASAREALQLRPDYGRAFQEIGYSHLGQNEPEAAAKAFASAVDVNPGLVASWKALVNLHARDERDERARFAQAQLEYLEALPPELRGVIDLVHEGSLLKAERLCREFLQHNKHHVEAMRLLADIGIRLRIYDDAEFLLESCVELAPDNIRARGDYVKILNRKGKFEAALEQSRLLDEQQPHNPAWRLGMASALMGVGRVDEAIAIYEDNLQRTANKPGVHVMLGHAYKARGELDRAINAYREACAAKPDYGDAYWSLANTKTYAFGDDELQRMRERESSRDVSEDDRIHLCFAIGKALEDASDYAASFHYYERGNRLKMAGSGYDPDLMSSMVQQQIDTCTRELFEKRGHLGSPRPDPIFIVGLPRAGSTLLEQILASHSQVDGTMELHEILGLAQRLRGRGGPGQAAYPHNLWELDDDYLERFGDKFIADTGAYRGEAAYFIDKMPNNFMHIGLIRLILPKAKVIDARRHPMACGFSGFKQLFGEGQDFSYALEAIGRYYSDYVRLMDHWDTVLPGFVLRVMHEDVVDDLETQVHRILDFCGLPFDEGCLEFHKTERNVKTPSSEQVRQPIYRSGLDYWRNYQQWLDPLKNALDSDIRHQFGIH
ncbi:MAG: sulfotransferase [Gammaproteobacteria bacterium]|nr:sulfotransferase [Gammaproteobacteria bacterium]